MKEDFNVRNLIYSILRHTNLWFNNISTAEREDADMSVLTRKIGVWI